MSVPAFGIDGIDYRLTSRISQVRSHNHVRVKRDVGIDIV